MNVRAGDAGGNGGRSRRRFRNREDHENARRFNFEVGENVKINDGPFMNFSGVIEEIDPERGKLKVTVNIFGRNTPVELGVLAGRESLR